MSNYLIENKLQNLIPVPVYFNGYKNIKGKGIWKLNKDYPFLYLQNIP